MSPTLFAMLLTIAIIIFFSLSQAGPIPEAASGTVTLVANPITNVTFPQGPFVGVADNNQDVLVPLPADFNHDLPNFPNLDPTPPTDNQLQILECFIGTGWETTYGSLLAYYDHKAGYADVVDYKLTANPVSQQISYLKRHENQWGFWFQLPLLNTMPQCMGDDVTHLQYCFDQNRPPINYVVGNQYDLVVEACHRVFGMDGLEGHSHWSIWHGGFGPLFPDIMPSVQPAGTSATQ